MLLTVAYTLLAGSTALRVVNVTLLPAALGVVAVSTYRLAREFLTPSLELCLAVVATITVLALGLNPSLVLIAAASLARSCCAREGRGDHLGDARSDRPRQRAHIWQWHGDGRGPAELVRTAEHVLSNDQLLFAFAIARVTPGQANLYVASIAYMMFGLLGATLSMVALPRRVT